MVTVGKFGQSKHISPQTYWYKLSDVNLVNGLVLDIGSPDTNGDYTTGAEVYMCHDTSGTASALPSSQNATVALLIFMLSGSLAGTAIVLRHKDRRIPAVICVLLAVGIAVSGGLLIGGQSAGVVSADVFDPGSLPSCAQGINDSFITNIHFNWETTDGQTAPSNASLSLIVKLATFLGNPSHTYTPTTDTSGIATVDTTTEGWFAAKVLELQINTGSLNLAGYNWILIYKLENGTWQEVGNDTVGNFATRNFTFDYTMNNNQAHFLLRACGKATITECQGLVTPVPPTPTPTVATDTPIPSPSATAVVTNGSVRPTGNVYVFKEDYFNEAMGFRAVSSYIASNFNTYFDATNLLVGGTPNTSTDLYIIGYLSTIR